MVKYLILSWIVGGLASAGFMNKSMEDGYHWDTKDTCEKWAHRDQSSSIILGLVAGPLALIPVMAFTGFGYKGWSLAQHKCNY